MADQEIWKDIPGYEGLYLVSDLGRVKGIRSGKILRPYLHKRGYLYLRLLKDKKK